MRKLILVLLGLFAFGCDFFSKRWVRGVLAHPVVWDAYYPYGGIGVFHNWGGIDLCLHLVFNRGGVWGLFPGYFSLLLWMRSIIAGAVLFYLLFLNQKRQYQWPLLLIFVGAAGNIFDSFYHGGVVDIFHVVLWGYSFPVFNLADIFIFFGVLIMIVLSFRRPDLHRSSREENTTRGRI